MQAGVTVPTTLLNDVLFDVNKEAMLLPFEPSITNGSII